MNGQAGYAFLFPVTSVRAECVHVIVSIRFHHPGRTQARQPRLATTMEACRMRPRQTLHPRISDHAEAFMAILWVSAPAAVKTAWTSALLSCLLSFLCSSAFSLIDCGNRHHPLLSCCSVLGLRHGISSCTFYVIYAAWDRVARVHTFVHNVSRQTRGADNVLQHGAYISTTPWAKRIAIITIQTIQPDKPSTPPPHVSSASCYPAHRPCTAS